MTFINRHLANIVAIAFGLTAAVAGTVLLAFGR
jgi:hypothetical protein